jgi:hypothetical protein
MSLNLSEPIREAVLGDPDITSYLGTYAGEPSVHTRRPVPSEATYPAVVISPDVSLTDFDALNGSRPIAVRDVAVYGQQPGSYRRVEELGYTIRELFHRRKENVVVDGYHVVDLVASGPIVAPTDDEKLVGRVVTLTFRLQKIGG